MLSERHVRLFRNGRNQAVRIPREFELDADEVVMRKEDDRIVIEPIRRHGLLATLATLSALDETMPDLDQDLRALDEIDL
ncbi:antitoxin [Acidithiobacillus sulfurivorans]|uniref:AbrB/MazE/SpoVT family DNA-binding domain-containing protein n=1 Tax=Acidithiobacillus sulfurivorans TaxID=1958756 RepID=A0ABS6A113_9PROT|nr:AbrB/MazE/SpoVT family DNA-binding domain-containing protein [Acidithiobacillus sulfurivorans]MBU2760563.1 AbrB/MazE/SpoVT family DNA-binding domain-containing protein [Acidithiobacillus sulfurivorans]